VTLDTATVEFTETGESWVLHIGHLDPISTLSGIFQRLQQLNYVAGSATLDPNNLDLLRAGLEALKASQASGGDATPDSTPASGPPSSPDSAPASNPSGANSGNSGLADDGTLDAATTALLLKVHGC
jgi:hypothetical protein